LAADSATYDVADRDVRAALARISAWDGLARSERLRSFLEYLVEETLAGRGSAIKAKTIGMDAYGYTVDELDGRESVVRVDAGRLRRKLEEYYGDVGKEDVVRLSLPKGGYTPTFERTAQAVAETSREVAQQKFSKFGRWSVGAVVVAAIIFGSGILLVQNKGWDKSKSVENKLYERRAIFDVAPNRLRSINLAEIGRDLIFPALGPGQLETAAVAFEEAIKIDEAYFGGYAGAAQVEATVALLEPNEELALQALERANTNAEIALGLAPQDAWSQSAMAWVDFAKGNVENASRTSALAVSLRPNDPHIAEFDTLISLYTGDFERVIAVSDRIELSLTGETGFVFRNAAGSARYHLGDYSATIVAFEQAIASGAPIGPPTLAYLMAAYEKLGQHDRAQKLAAQYTHAWPNARIDLVLRRLFVDVTHAEDIIGVMLKAGWSPNI
jgi:tetratricopeptide (TPR) repeat protein